MLRARTALLVAAVLASTMGGALACSCASPTHAKSHTEAQAWRLEQATDVVQGRIAEVWGGQLDSQRVLLAKMLVSSVVKGDVPTGEITLISRLNSASCGVPETLLMGFETAGDVALEVFKVPGDEKKYQISYCGYRDYMARKRQPSR